MKWSFWEQDARKRVEAKRQELAAALAAEEAAAAAPEAAAALPEATEEEMAQAALKLQCASRQKVPRRAGQGGRYFSPLHESVVYMGAFQ